MEVKPQQTQQNKSTSDDMIDLKLFERQEKIEIHDHKYKYYKVMNILTGTKNIIKSSRIPFNEFTKKMMLSFYREVDNNIKLNHPSILNINGYSLIDFKGRNKPTIILEYISQKSLENHFNESDFDKKKSQNVNSKVNENKINIRSIYKTELNNVQFDYNCININNFEKRKLINIKKKYKLYEVECKKDKTLFFAEKSTSKFENIWGIKKQIFITKLNNAMMLNHPSILKFIGYSPVGFKDKPFPTIITEHASNSTLKSLFDLN